MQSVRATQECISVMKLNAKVLGAHEGTEGQSKTGSTVLSVVSDWFSHYKTEDSEWTHRVSDYRWSNKVCEPNDSKSLGFINSSLMPDGIKQMSYQIYLIPVGTFAELYINSNILKSSELKVRYQSLNHNQDIEKHWLNEYILYIQTFKITLRAANYLQGWLISTFGEYLTPTAENVVEGLKNTHHKPVWLNTHRPQIAASVPCMCVCVFYQRQWRYAGGGLGAVSGASSNHRESGKDWRTSSSSLIEEKGMVHLASLKLSRKAVPPLHTQKHTVN